MRNYILGGVAALALIAVAACGGGQGSPGVGYPTVPNSGGGTLASAGTAITLPATTGLAVGSANVQGKGSVTVAQSVSAPGSLPAIQLKTRSVAPVKGATVTSTAIAYVTVTASSASTISGVSVTVVPTGTVPAGPYQLAFWNGSQWVTLTTASVTESNGEITAATGTITPAITLAAGASLSVAIYTGQVFVTPPPPPVASPNPASMDLLTSTTITVQTGDNDVVTATSSNTSIATIAASATADATGAATFQVTSAAPGTTTLTFTDPYGKSTTDVLTVINALPSPSPAAAAVTIAVAQQTTIQVSTAAGLVITAQSSNTSAVTLASATETANSSGIATFTITGAGAGASTLTFTDPYSDAATMSVSVSSITNGSFTNGTTGWTPCSYHHTDFAAMYSPSPSPTPTAWSTQKPTLSYTPNPDVSPALFVVGTPPANDRIIQAATYTSPAPPAGVGTTPPPILGSDVALIGSTSSIASPAGEFGICQTFTLSANSPYLSFWVFEGGSSYKFSQADQEAVILNSTGTTLEQELFVELNCYQDQSAPGLGTSGQFSYDCDPTSAAPNQYYDWGNGGYWVQRGPYNLLSASGTPGTLTAGTPYTLYVGQWSYYANAANSYYSQYLFLGDVQTSASSTFPTVAPMAKTRSVTLQLPTKRLPASVKPVTKPIH